MYVRLRCCFKYCKRSTGYYYLLVLLSYLCARTWADVTTFNGLFVLATTSVDVLVVVLRISEFCTKFYPFNVGLKRIRYFSIRIFFCGKYRIFEYYFWYHNESIKLM